MNKWYLCLCCALLSGGSVLSWQPFRSFTCSICQALRDECEGNCGYPADCIGKNCSPARSDWSSCFGGCVASTAACRDACPTKVAALCDNQFCAAVSACVDSSNSEGYCAKQLAAGIAYCNSNNADEGDRNWCKKCVGTLAAYAHEDKARARFEQPGWCTDMVSSCNSNANITGSNKWKCYCHCPYLGDQNSSHCWTVAGAKNMSAVAGNALSYCTPGQ